MYSLSIFKDRRSWVKDRRLHRACIKPALFFKNEPDSWFFDGILYLDRGDFLKSSNSSYVNATYVYKTGMKIWTSYVKKKSGWCEVIHRNRLPAVEYANGDCEYWNFGCRHRLNGPAVIYGNKKYFFKDGEFVKCIV